MATNDSPAGQCLCAPAPPSISARTIDFKTTPLKNHNYNDHFAMIIDNALTLDECKTLLSLVQTSTNNNWPVAEVNAGSGKQTKDLWTRNCGRIIHNSPIIADRLLTRILPSLPAEIVNLTHNSGITGNGPVKRKETWRITRLNEKFRFLKYEPGHYFREHCDGSFRTEDGKETSFLTVHLYLNDEGLEGGATRFLPGNFQESPCFDVNPKAGSVLVFQHRGLWHEGAEVVNGVKYTVRTDVMYSKVEEKKVSE